MRIPQEVVHGATDGRTLDDSTGLIAFAGQVRCAWPCLQHGFHIDPVQAEERVELPLRKEGAVDGCSEASGDHVDVPVVEDKLVAARHLHMLTVDEHPCQQAGPSSPPWEEPVARRARSTDVGTAR